MHALTTTRHGQSDEWERKVRVCRRVLDRRRERLEVSSRGGWPVASYNVAAEAAELRRSRRRRQRCVCVWIFLKIAYAITVSEILRQRVGGWTTSVGVQRERDIPPADWQRVPKRTAKTGQFVGRSDPVSWVRLGLLIRDDSLSRTLWIAPLMWKPKRRWINAWRWQIQSRHLKWGCHGQPIANPQRFADSATGRAQLLKNVSLAVKTTMTAASQVYTYVRSQLLTPHLLCLVSWFNQNKDMLQYYFFKNGFLFQNEKKKKRPFSLFPHASFFPPPSAVPARSLYRRGDCGWKETTRFALLFLFQKGKELYKQKRKKGEKDTYCWR